MHCCCCLLGLDNKMHSAAVNLSGVRTKTLMTLSSRILILYKLQTVYCPNDFQPIRVNYYPSSDIF